MLASVVWAAAGVTVTAHVSEDRASGTVGHGMPERTLPNHPQDQAFVALSNTLTGMQQMLSDTRIFASALVQPDSEIVQPVTNLQALKLPLHQSLVWSVQIIQLTGFRALWWITQITNSFYARAMQAALEAMVAFSLNGRVELVRRTGWPGFGQPLTKTTDAAPEDSGGLSELEQVDSLLADPWLSDRAARSRLDEGEQDEDEQLEDQSLEEEDFEGGEDGEMGELEPPVLVASSRPPAATFLELDLKPNAMVSYHSSAQSNSTSSIAKAIAAAKAERAQLLSPMDAAERGNTVAKASAATLAAKLIAAIKAGDATKTAPFDASSFARLEPAFRSTSSPTNQGWMGQWPASLVPPRNDHGWPGGYAGGWEKAASSQQVEKEQANPDAHQLDTSLLPHVLNDTTPAVGNASRAPEAEQIDAEMQALQARMAELRARLEQNKEQQGAQSQLPRRFSSLAYLQQRRLMTTMASVENAKAVIENVNTLRNTGAAVQQKIRGIEHRTSMLANENYRLRSVVQALVDSGARVPEWLSKVHADLDFCVQAYWLMMTHMITNPYSGFQMYMQASRTLAQYSESLWQYAYATYGATAGASPNSLLPATALMKALPG